MGVGGQNGNWVWNKRACKRKIHCSTRCFLVQFERLTGGAEGDNADYDEVLRSAPRSALLRTTVAAMQLQSAKHAGNEHDFQRLGRSVLENNRIALKQEPLNWQIYATNAKISWVLQMMADRRKVVLGDGEEGRGAADLLNQGASRVSAAFAAGWLTADEAAESLCDLAIAAWVSPTDPLCHGFHFFTHFAVFLRVLASNTIKKRKMRWEKSEAVSSVAWGLARRAGRTRPHSRRLLRSGRAGPRRQTERPSSAS